MRIALCIAIKNRSFVVVEPEDSLQYLQHFADKVQECETLRQEPWRTKQGKIALPLFPKMIRSLMSHKRPEDDWVIIVVDYGSTDVKVQEILEVEVGSKALWHLESITDYPFFDRGGGLAKAAEIAETKFQAEGLFFCDADLLFGTRDVLDGALQVIQDGRFYYPIFFAFATADHSKGFWRDTSYGNFACRLEDYKKTEGWYHNVSWGWEDRALADAIPESKKERQMVQGFFHQWHPMEWDFRVKEYPVKKYIFREAAVKTLPFQ